MGDRLAGKVALVTGGARGLGEAVTLRFVEEGARVIIGDLLVDEGRRLEAMLSERLGPETVVYERFDVSSPEAWAGAMDVARDRFGGLDILVNNAGRSAPPVGLERMSIEDWHGVVAVNQTGTMLGIRSVVPLMRERGGGSIVNVASIYALIAAASSPAYQASKGAVRMLSRAAALEYAPEGIRVNTVFPGLTDTAILAAQGRERIEYRLTRTPMNRIAHPREVANGILFLASDEASFITGAELVIDGGYTAA